MKFIKLFLLALTLFLLPIEHIKADDDTQKAITSVFPIRGFHLDLRIQVMKLTALKDLALQLKHSGINTLIMEYEASFPYEKHAIVSSRYAYTKAELIDFIQYCNCLLYTSDAADE